MLHEENIIFYNISLIYYIVSKNILIQVMALFTGKYSHHIPKVFG